MARNALQLGHQAVEQGLITTQQLNLAMAQLDSAAAPQELGRVLLELGQLGPAQTSALEALRLGASGPREEGDLTGLSLGGCVIQERIGEGSMGTTYRAHHSRLDRLVVLKVLHPRLVAIEGNLERFAYEARAAANLEHPGVVSVYDFDSDAGYHFIVMQFVEGQNLTEVLASRGALGLRRGLWIGARVLEGLAHAHSRGIVHRDIKPANLLLTREPRVKIADFGLVRILTLTTTERISVFGEIIGTPLYMSPEQATGDDVDGRTDLYSLGISLFELIAGRVPFPGTTTMEVLEQHCLKPLPNIGELLPGSDMRALQTFLESLTAKDCEERFANAEEALEALQDLRQAESAESSEDASGRLPASGSQSRAEDPSRRLEDAPPLVSPEALTGFRTRLRRVVKGSDDSEALLSMALGGVELARTPAEDARHRIDEALANSESDVGAVEVLGELYSRGLIHELLALAPRLEAALPASAGVAFFVGKALAHQGRLDEARPRLSLATVLAPDHLPARLHLARTLVAIGQAEEAVETLREATRWHPSSALLSRRLAELLWVILAEPEQAVPVFERAVELAPTRLELRLQLAWVLCELRRYVQAEAVLVEGQAWRAEPAVTVLLTHARRKQAENPASKLASDTDLGEGGPGPVTSARLDAIHLAASSGRWQRALQVSEQGLAERPRSVPLLLARGKAQLELGHPEQAVESFGLALSADPGNQEAHQGLIAAQEARRRRR